MIRIILGSMMKRLVFITAHQVDRYGDNQRVCTHGRSQNLNSVMLKLSELKITRVKIIRIYIQWGQNYKI